MRERECKCGAPMEFEAADPDVGIMSDAWVCTACDNVELVDDIDNDD